jgi:hypothetical protein
MSSGKEDLDKVCSRGSKDIEFIDTLKIFVFIEQENFFTS